MIFAHTHQWITGVSPHTGKPKTMTRRIEKAGDVPIWYDGVVGVERNGRLIYTLDQTIAVQTGRSQKAVGRTPPIKWIGKEDVRNISEADARAEGFASRLHFLYTWAFMHDKHMHRTIQFADTLTPVNAANYLYDLNRCSWSTRPAKFYIAWVLDWTPNDATQHRSRLWMARRV